MRIGFRLRCRAGSTLLHLRSGASGVHYTSLEGTDDWSCKKRGWERSSCALQRKKRRVPGGAEILRGRQREGDEQRERKRVSDWTWGGQTRFTLHLRADACNSSLPSTVAQGTASPFPAAKDSRSLSRPLHATERMRSQPRPWGSRV